MKISKPTRLERQHTRWLAAPDVRPGVVLGVFEIECPFCQQIERAYAWSLAGSGKRCVCGAIHKYRNNMSYLAVEVEVASE